MASRSPADLPATGLPGTVVEKRDASGKVVQKRHHGADGRAVKNIDYGHDHTDVGDPHVHDWDWSKKSPRQTARALKPGE